jgi:1-deoxy-D-xylulose-5-phosphate synthase
VVIDPHAPALPIGRGRLLRQGQHVALLAFGTLLAQAEAVADGFDATVADMRFVKPLDEELILELAQGHDLLVTIEDNAVAGGAGSAVAELLAERGVLVRCIHLGLPDRYVEHAEQSVQLAECGLDAEGITARIQEELRNFAPELARRLTAIAV